MSYYGPATLTQAKHTLELIARHDLNSGQMSILHDGYLSDLLEAIKFGDLEFSDIASRDEMRIALGMLPLNPTLNVDYDLSLEDAIALGNYEDVNHGLFEGEFLKEWLAEQNVSNGKKRLKIILVSEQRSVNLEENEIEKVFGNKNYRLASYKELLAFGATYPKLQRSRAAIFGKSYPGPTSFKARRFHPSLYNAFGSRGLDLESRGVHSNPHTNFLFVEK